MIALVIHGGAGDWPVEKRPVAQAACDLALEEAYMCLRDGGTALDVVELAVSIMEDDPVFDAGRGSYPNTDGHVEMDAIIVDGGTLRFGAVAAIRNVQHPVQVARAVMANTPHCMLVGSGATRFAHENGFPFCADAWLLSSEDSGNHGGTVGAVALDAHGHIAAATSTGGVRDKMPGRVGDTPLIGCGAIADDRVVGVSCTGIGEHLMRVTMAKRVADYIQSSETPDVAVSRAVRDLEQLVNGKGGVICLDVRGRVGCAFNTAHMIYAYVDGLGRRAGGSRR